MSQHNVTGYFSRKCRCEVCKQAAMEYMRKRKAERIQMLKDGLVEIEHGTLSAYGNWGCRCDECKEARRIEARRRYKTNEEL